MAELWEAPEGRRDWRVPVVAVEDAIRAACARWRVLEVAADLYSWQRGLEVLDGDGTPVSEFFQTAAGMGPAKDSPRRIDAAVAAIMAVHRAAELAGASRPDIYI